MATIATSGADPGCPFCKRIAAGEYSDSWDFGGEEVVAFEPLDPVTPGHMLVVPRKHVANALESPVLAGHAMKFAGYLANELGLGSVNFITSAGAAASQSVFHLHWHVVPRSEGDGLPLPWTPQKEAGRA